MKPAPAGAALLAAPDYRDFIAGLKQRVAAAQLSAARSVNCDLILLYWDIGRAIVEKQKLLGWGESVVDMVSADLVQAFPSMTGLSPRNLRARLRLLLRRPPIPRGARHEGVFHRPALLPPLPESARRF